MQKLLFNFVSVNVDAKVQNSHSFFDMCREAIKSDANSSNTVLILLRKGLEDQPISTVIKLIKTELSRADKKDDVCKVLEQFFVDMLFDKVENDDDKEFILNFISESKCPEIKKMYVDRMLFEFTDSNKFIMYSCTRLLSHLNIASLAS